MEGRYVLAIFLILLLLGLAGTLLIFGYQYRESFIMCQNEESVFCFTNTCRNQTKTCGDFAYRCVGDGKVRCSNAPMLDVDIDPTEKDICGAE